MTLARAQIEAEEAAYIGALECALERCEKSGRDYIMHLERALERSEKRIRELGCDGVTRLPTRLQCDEHVADAWHRTLRSGGRFGVMIIDADNFKLINDELGHSAGDDALRRIADAIRASVRRADFVGRWGGDEFIVVMEGASAEGIRRVAINIHDRVRVETPVSVTVGCAIEGPTKFIGTNAQDIIDEADRDLLKRKRKR